MFDPTWLIVVVIVGVWLFLGRRNASRGEFSWGSQSLVEKSWNLAEKSKQRVLEYNHSIDDYLYDVRELLRAMEMDSIHLLERFKHDESRQLRIALDWFEYANAMRCTVTVRELLNASVYGEHDELARKLAKENRIAIQGIEKRVIDELRDLSALKGVLAELERESELDLTERQQLIERRRRPRPTTKV